MAVDNYSAVWHVVGVCVRAIPLRKNTVIPREKRPLRMHVEGGSLSYRMFSTLIKEEFR